MCDARVAAKKRKGKNPFLKSTFVEFSAYMFVNKKAFLFAFVYLFFFFFGDQKLAGLLFILNFGSFFRF